MYSRKDQIELIKSIKVTEGESKTIDCPFCSGRKKFSITNNAGTILWNCYKASCTARGVYKKGMSLSSLRKRTNSIPLAVVNQVRKIPEITSSPKHHSIVLDYLAENGCNPAIEQSLIKVAYAPADNRCLFFMNGGEGAVGRSLDGRKPKWMSYGDTSGVVTVGNSDHGVIVEDAPSACAVGAIGRYTGIAILGTSLSTKQKQTMKSYRKITICLDNDAKKKAMLLLRQLQGQVDCTVKFINKDLKYSRESEIVRIISNEM